MTLKQYLILMSAGTLFCWLAFVAVLWGVNPETATALELTFVYLSLFLAMLGTCSVLGFLLRAFILKKEDIIFRHVKHTFRQSLIIALTIVLVFMLLGLKLLTWWNLILLVLLALFLEAIVFTNRKFRNTSYGS